MNKTNDTEVRDATNGERLPERVDPVVAAVLIGLFLAMVIAGYAG
jgi:hypothetical protein